MFPERFREIPLVCLFATVSSARIASEYILSALFIFVTVEIGFQRKLDPIFRYFSHEKEIRGGRRKCGFVAAVGGGGGGGNACCVTGNVTVQIIC